MGKVREGRKAVPANKMPELGWDIAETDIQTITKNTQPDNQQTPHILQIMITIAFLIASLLEFIKTHIQKIPSLTKTVTKSTKGAFKRINNTRFIQNIRESHSKARLAVTIAMGTTSRTSHTTPTAKDNNNKPKVQACENLMTDSTDHTSHTHPGPTRNNTTKEIIVNTIPALLCKDQAKHGNTQRDKL